MEKVARLNFSCQADAREITPSYATLHKNFLLSPSAAVSVLCNWGQRSVLNGCTQELVIELCD